MPGVCMIGLDEPEHSAIRARVSVPVLARETLPRMVVRDGQLLVEPPSGAGYRPVSAVVFHGIFEEDHDSIAGLALWGGPCLPSARAMMDCRLKLPCLVRALELTRFGAPPRGYASPGAEYPTETERVTKWGNWHCGENKARFRGSTVLEESSIVEPFLVGEAVRVVVIGDAGWQIRLAGDDWLKSIHDDRAALMDLDADLWADTRAVARGLGLDVAANDYIRTQDGVPHLLEVNHVPNVTRFPEIWEAYADHVVDWIGAVT